jgi:hypothetical protein
MTRCTRAYVEGPGSATPTAIAIYDGYTGKLIKNSLVTIDSSGNISTPGTVDGYDLTDTFGNINTSLVKTLIVDQTASVTSVSMPDDTVTELISVVISGLNVSSRYIATIGARATIYQDGYAARPELIQDVDITTDGSGVATCTFLHDAIILIDKCTSIPTATLSIALDTGGIAISGYQNQGSLCTGAITVYLTNLLKVS